METSSKCSAKTHKEVDAILFCEKCQIFMCNKCLNHHKELFENHQLFTLDKNNNELFINFCRIDGHEKKFEYFCKTDNEFCVVFVALQKSIIKDMVNIKIAIFVQLMI